MRKTREDKKSKLRRYMGAPIRFLSKARDFYVESMVSLDGRVSYNNMVVGPTPHMTKLPMNFNNVNSSKKNNGTEDIRELFRTVSKRKVESEIHRKPPGWRQQVMAVGPNGVGRSYSVGLGRIGTIEEDWPCDFQEEEEEIIMKSEILYPRSRSYVVTRRNVGYH